VNITTNSETKFRSWIKSISWRIIGVSSGGIVIFLSTGKFLYSMKLSMYANIVGFVLYYFHERIWNRISWGKSSGV